MTFFRSCLLLVTFEFIAMPLYAAPLNCEQATPPIETVICQVIELQEMHKLIEQIYTKTLKEAKNETQREFIQLTQQNWLKHHNECGLKAEPVEIANCLVKSFLERAENLAFINSKEYEKSRQSRYETSYKLADIAGIYENPEKHFRVILEAMKPKGFHVIVEGGKAADFPTSKQLDWQCNVDLKDDSEFEFDEGVTFFDTPKGGIAVEFTPDKLTLKLSSWGVNYSSYCDPENALDVTLKKR